MSEEELKLIAGIINNIQIRINDHEKRMRKIEDGRNKKHKAEAE